MFRKQTEKKHQSRFVNCWEGKPLLLVTGLLITAICLLWVVHPPGIARFAGNYAYDAMVNSRADSARSSVPVIVRIDEESLALYGQWPWPRYRLAQLVNRLKELKAQVVVLDILMPESDRTSPEVIARERVRDLGDTDFYAAPRQTNDQLLAEALASLPTIAGFKFDDSAMGKMVDHEGPRPLNKIIVQQEPGHSRLLQAPSGVVSSIPQLAAAFSGHGFTNSHIDQDGVLRRVPLLLKGEGGYYPALALRALMEAMDVRYLHLVQRPGEMFLKWRNRSIPLDSFGHLLVDFRSGEQPFQEISAADLLSNETSVPSLEGKIVFVGASAAALGDRHVTPLVKNLPGPVVHATVVENILTGKFLTSPGWTLGAEFFFVLLLGLLSTFVLLKSGFWGAILLLATGSTGVVWLSFSQLQTRGLFISPVMSVVVLLMNVALLNLLKFGIESRKLRRRTRDLVLAQEATIVSMTALAEARDDSAGDHITRTQRYVEIMARYLQSLPEFTAELSDEAIELIGKSAPLHDIGKIAISDEILFKPALHTPEESLHMQNHTIVGASAIRRAIATLEHSEQSGYLSYALQMVESHHEKWDGTGYPYGLEGDAIPLAARLMSLADVYDALISSRCYKAPYSHEVAKELILSEKEISFDPAVVNAFIACEGQFKALTESIQDSFQENGKSTVVHDATVDLLARKAASPD